MPSRNTPRQPETAGGISGWLPQPTAIALAAGLAFPASAVMAQTVPATPPDPNVTTLAYNFDSRLLLGSDLGVADIERFNRASAIEPGDYRVDVFVNDTFIARKAVDFRESGNGNVYPCLDDEFLKSVGVLVTGAGASDKEAGAETGRAAGESASAQEGSDVEHAQHAGAQCMPLAQRVPGATTSADMSRLRLDISVPQALMKRAPRGSIEPASLDAGQTMAYVNYDSNYYTASSFGRQFDSFYTGINAGMNVGLWRLHQQSAFTYFGGTAGSEAHWNNIRTYAERPLLSIGSKLVVGQSYTTSNLFSSVGFTGFQIETDDRMLPDSMRGYAPVVNGVANTNARVVVSQSGNVIYQTTVAPGPFSINDLNATSYQGDLTVQVFEANGQVSTFTVPFSSVPNSLRPGMSHFSATVGQVRNVEGSSAKFADITYERGLTNMLTANAGARLSDQYQSLASGVVLGTPAGAFGLNAAWSNALDEHGKRVNGWMASLNYSHTIQPTQTTFSLAGYRYSTGGYRDFADALSARAAARSGTEWSSYTYKQRDQLTVNVNQYLGNYGSLSLSASASSYYGGKDRDTQLQLSYSNHYRSLNYNLSFIRQQTGTMYTNGAGGIPGLSAGMPQKTGFPSRTTNAVMATVSIPLGSGPRSASLSSSLAHTTDQGVSLQTSVSGVVDEAQTLTYGVTVSGQTEGGAKSVSANIQKNLSMITMGANYSRGNNYWQAGANARGAAVIHSGGVTLGPYLSDTFGVVEAKGAEGASVRNAQGARVNGSGYAIVPSLTPYRYNDVALDAKGINPNAELSGGQLRVAPYAGSAVLLKFATRTGHAVLIGANGPDGQPLPLGANVFDSTGAAIGVVGQGSQVYARVPAEQGVLNIKWSDRRDDQCWIAYDIKGMNSKAPLLRLDAPCLLNQPAMPTVAAASKPKHGAAQ
jgi:outer membrane usher protein